MKGYFVCIISFLLLSGHPLSAQETKSQLQQELLLSRQQQLDLERQKEQKLLLEKQKQQLAEQEKALLTLRFEKKQAVLENEKRQQAERLKNEQLRAKYEASIKDRQINVQITELSNTRRWVTSLIVVSILVLLVAGIIFYSQRKQKKLNRLISAQHAELEQVSMVKDRLLSVVGHDMRSPLNMLDSLTHILREGDIPPERMRLYMDQLESTLVYTSSMMDNLLQWAASQMQGYKPVIREVSVSEVAQDIIRLVNERAAAKKLSLLNTIPEGTTARCDADMLSLVLRNLLSNSIKFTPVNGTVQISASVKDKTLVLSIADNGVGMSKEKQEQFNASGIVTAGSTPGTEKEKGTGLGLVLCKTFAQLMNGQLFVRDNSPGTGCIFEMTLPLENEA